MKRKLVKALGVILTAGMFAGNVGPVGVRAENVNAGQVETDSSNSDADTEMSSENREEDFGMDDDGAESSVAASEEPLPGESSAGDSESSITAIPSEVEEPGESESPSATDEPEVTEQPSVTLRPLETGIPAVTPMPTGTEHPVNTSGPAKTETPAVTSAPADAGHPAKPSGPVETESPAVTSAPTSTAGPAGTKNPSGTSKPAGTMEPSATPKAEGTVKPSDMTKPTETPKPSATSNPAGTESPTDSAKPVGTSNPDIWKSPRPTEEEKISNGWVEVEGKYYWYEEGVKRGIEGAGEEVYDAEADAWYWLDAADDGARAANKAVLMDTDGGKLVYYGEDGRRVKGEYRIDGEDYYFEAVTGAMVKGPMLLADGRKVFYDLDAGRMVKGDYEVNGEIFHFDEENGELLGGYNSEFWLLIDGSSYWYVDWERQGWNPEDAEYRGEEMLDPVSGEWVWLDGLEQGRQAVNKVIYLESIADKEGNIGKWVYYDQDGHMLRGWSEDGLYYGDPIYGTMARGIKVIGNKEYEFDSESGMKLSERVISGFEAFGIECNAEPGTVYKYVTACDDYPSITTIAETVFDYSVIGNDETHSAKEGYEWKKAVISMKFDNKSARQFGYQYALMCGLDYYTFNNNAINSVDSEAYERTGSISMEGMEYDIVTRYSVLENGWREDGAAYVTICFECQVPAGYDGMTVVLYNAKNIDNSDHVVERLDSDSIIFQME